MFQQQVNLRLTLDSEIDVRIALLTQGLFHSGGVQTVTRWLKKQLEAHGHDVTIIDVDTSSVSRRSRRVCRPRSWVKSLEVESLAGEESIKQVGTSLAEFELARYLPQKALTRELDTYDLIQVVCGGPALAVKALKSSAPVVVQMATLARLERAANIREAQQVRKLYGLIMTALVSLMERFALAKVEAVMVENREILNILQEMGVNNVHYAPPGVDTDYFVPVRAGGGERGPLVYFGRLGAPRKGVGRLIDSYLDACSLDSSIPPLCLAGRGTISDDDMSRLLRSPHRSKVEIRSDLSAKEALELLQTGSVFVQASYEEGLGIALLEAMSCGMPAIATETAGTLETVDPGVNGVLLSQDRFSGESLLGALSEIQSSRATYVLGARKSVVQSFSSQATVHKFLSVYKLVFG